MESDEKFNELDAVTDTGELSIRLRRSESDVLTPFQRGFLNGKLSAMRVLDLAYSTEMMQVGGGWMPDIRPATKQERRGWLRGYASGVLSVTDDPEAHD